LDFTFGFAASVTSVVDGEKVDTAAAIVDELAEGIAVGAVVIDIGAAVVVEGDTLLLEVEGEDTTAAVIVDNFELVSTEDGEEATAAAVTVLFEPIEGDEPWAVGEGSVPRVFP
jgi:hypothetical protein